MKEQKIKRCQSEKCAQEVMWVQIDEKRTLINAKPSTQGNVALIGFGGGIGLARVLSNDAAAAARENGDTLYLRHVVTCRDRGAFNKKQSNVVRGAFGAERSAVKAAA
jgi:hypothetical protein